MAEKPIKGFRIKREVSDRFSEACRDRDYRASHVVEALMVTWLQELREERKHQQQYHGETIRVPISRQYN